MPSSNGYNYKTILACKDKDIIAEEGVKDFKRQRIGEDWDMEKFMSFSYGRSYIHKVYQHNCPNVSLRRMTSLFWSN